MKARVVAAQTLAAVAAGKSLVNTLPQATERVQEHDKALLNQLIYGTLREWPRLDAILTQRLERPLKTKDSDVRALLMLGLYQLDCMRIPAHAVVSETVAGARGLQKPWARGLINAVLRGFIREGAPALNDAQAAALPAWWWGKLGKQWPKQRAEIAATARSQPPLTLRINTARMSRDDYCRLLAERDVAFSLPVYSTQAITLLNPLRVTELPGFSEGLVSIQDATAQLAAQLLGCLPHETVLDACAAPGGKTCHIAELEPTTKILATDSSEQRLERIVENVSRLRLQNVALRCMDASQAATVLDNASFDAILADVPCSASGVTRRNPDIKILRQADDLQRFASQQKAIVEGLWPLLKPGGRLLYVTCSIFNEENDQVVQHCADTLLGAVVEPTAFTSGIPTLTGCQRLPDLEGDGLFFAQLRRLEV